MDYARALIWRVKDSSRWPSFERGDFLDKLDALAAKAFSTKTTFGYLAAVLIYHQLCEEMIGLLIRDSEFFIQLSIFPTEIHFRQRKKYMFGRLLEDLKSTIEFEHKKDIIQKAEQLNTIRIQIVHGLTKRTSLKEIRGNALKMKRLYEGIYRDFDEALDWFRLCFKDFKKDIDWDDYLEN